MWQRIKSTYFYQKLFFHIDEKLKLDLIKYNKSFQKILDKSLIDYQKLSGKYIIYEGEGIGKIYNSIDNKLIFEGELLKGKKNGKGKEYYSNGKIKFIGEYYNGMKWNGFGYDCNDNIIYELAKGKGYIKEYNNDFIDNSDKLL